MPRPPEAEARCAGALSEGPVLPPGLRGSKAAARARPPSRLPWALLLRRVCREEVLECNRCGGRRVVLAFVIERSAVKAILEHLRLPTTGPPVAPARSNPQMELVPWPDEPDDSLQAP